MCKTIYWGFMSVVSWLLAPVKMRYPSKPFLGLALSNLQYAQWPEFSIFSTGCACFICFITFNQPQASISRISQWNKGKKEENDNKHRDGLHSLYLQIMQRKQSSGEYWLHIKNQTLWMCEGEIALKRKECFSPRLRQSWMKDVRF